MEIYRLRADSNHYEGLLPTDKADLSIFESFDGNTQKPWNSPAMIVSGSENTNQKITKLKRGDFPSLLPYIPVFSNRAIDMLHPFLECTGEILPLECKERDYYAFNVTCIINALDETKSVVKRFSSGKVMRIVKYFFMEKTLKDIHIFNIPQFRRSDVFVDEIFVAQVQKTKLEGFLFEKVWNS